MEVLVAGGRPRKARRRILKGEKPAELPRTQSIDNKYVDFVAPPRSNSRTGCFLVFPLAP